MSSSSDRIEVWRLQDVSGWELYELVEEPGGGTLCTIATRFYPDSGQVEYGLWLSGKSEPEFTASVEAEGDKKQWSDAERQDALASIVYKHLDRSVYDRALHWYLDSSELQAFADQHA